MSGGSKTDDNRFLGNSVKLTRNAKGQTQIEVKCERETMDEVLSEVKKAYEALRTVYPLD